MHLLVHYPHILVESGSMPYLSMIRNEGKHKEIKERAAATNSRKNITHTLALKQQLKLCYHFTSEEGLQNETHTGRSQIIENIECLENYGNFSDSLPDYFKESSLLSLKWVTFKETNYRECVLIEDLFNPFPAMKAIFSNGKKFVALKQML